MRNYLYLFSILVVLCLYCCCILTFALQLPLLLVGITYARVSLASRFLRYATRVCVMTSHIYHTHEHTYMYPLNLQLPPPWEHTSPSTVGPFSSTLRAVPSSSTPYSYESHCGNAGDTHADVHAHIWIANNSNMRDECEAFVSTPLCLSVSFR